MTEQHSQDIYRSDYCPPKFVMRSVRLDVRLDPKATRVHATLEIDRQGLHKDPLILHGEGLRTLSVAVDSGLRDLPENTAQTLSLADVPDHFTLTTEVEINPDANTSLNGLYRSNGIFCTQCEPEGFRRITWGLDRPDVMATYEVRIEASRHLAPVLLSNGDCVETGDLGNGRHFAVWRDPFPKPTYLFALVAGDLKAVRDSFQTQSGRMIDLAIHVRAGDEPLCSHAMDSLKRAMRWDEEVYGLEYDLNQFNIVSVDDFNFGAMENKSLNIFNSKYVLADARTASDADFSGIEAVIAHEYFHNWTGNRVTCRDWFQLSLKEGLTVFRDHEFSADMGDRTTERISQVRRLRTVQFAEDAGPLSHSVRPESYREIDYFYTATVYEKGSEVVRMYRTLMGPDLYRQGVDLYFARHDGTAATCDDFLAAMRDASEINLSGFDRWYSQSGTPRLQATGQWNRETQTYKLTLRQTPAHSDQAPFLIPIDLALIGRTSGVLPLNLPDTVAHTKQGDRIVIHFRDEQQEICFSGVEEDPVPSLLGGFSAPVHLDQDCSDEDLAFLIDNDNDGFNRWQASQTLSERVLIRKLDNSAEPDLIDQRTKGLNVLLEAFGRVLNDEGLSDAARAQILTLPMESEIACRVDVIDAPKIRAVRKSLQQAIGSAHATDLKRVYALCDQDGPYTFFAPDCGRRTLLGVCLGLLSAGGESSGLERAEELVTKSRNMTEVLLGLGVLANWPMPGGKAALDAFYDKWSDQPLVVNKWLRLQATADHDDVIDMVRSLTDHPAFTWTNPNNVYSLIGGFAMGNVPWLHAPSGAGLTLIHDAIVTLDRINPQVAARIAGAFSAWRRVEPKTRNRIEGNLRKLSALSSLSRNTREIIDKSLA